MLGTTLGLVYVLVFLTPNSARHRYLSQLSRDLKNQEERAVWCALRHQYDQEH